MAWRPTPASARVILSAQSVLNEYPYPITFKQLFYRLAAGGVVEYTESSYRALNSLVTKARKHGRLHPSLFVPPQESPSTASVERGYFSKALQEFRLDRLQGQPSYVEIWVEKNTMLHFVQSIVKDFDIPVYSSQSDTTYSFTYQAYRRINEQVRKGKIPRIIWLSDLSVSSVNIFESFLNDMAALFEVSYRDISSIIFQLGVAPEHVVYYGLVPAPFPCKDKRLRQFEAKYGDLLQSIDLPRNTCVDIESIDPKDLRDLIFNTLFSLIDYGTIETVIEEESNAKRRLTAVLKSAT